MFRRDGARIRHISFAKGRHLPVDGQRMDARLRADRDRSLTNSLATVCFAAIAIRSDRSASVVYLEICDRESLVTVTDLRLSGAPSRWHAILGVIGHFEVHLRRRVVDPTAHSVE